MLSLLLNAAVLFNVIQSQWFIILTSLSKLLNKLTELVLMCNFLYFSRARITHTYAITMYKHTCSYIVLCERECLEWLMIRVWLIKLCWIDKESPISEHLQSYKMYCTVYCSSPMNVYKTCIVLLYELSCVNFQGYEGHLKSRRSSR